MKHFSTVKYLGDILNAQDSNVDLIKSRVNKCHRSVAELISYVRRHISGNNKLK